MLDRFQPVTDALWELLPAIASERVVPYFKRASVPIDRVVANTMVRHSLKSALTDCFPTLATPGDVQDYSEALVFKRLANHGIESCYRGTRFKIVSTRGRWVPPPGNSEHRLEFYNNDVLGCQLSLFGESAEKTWRQLNPNVVILWNYDDAYESLALMLAVPDKATSPFGEVKCAYIVDVPLRGEHLLGIPPIQTDNLDPVPTDDLDVRPVEQTTESLPDNTVTEDRKEGE